MTPPVPSVLMELSSLLMRNVVVAGNRGHADGLTGDTQGGGIWNGMFPLPFLDGLDNGLRLSRT